MSRRLFAKLKFQGERFSGPVFPVEALPELAAYRDLVVTAAKSLWRADNPERSRLPRGFEARLGLVLETVEAGSAVPVLSRVPTGSALSQGLFPGMVDSYYEKARDLVEATVQNVREGRGLPHEVTFEIGAKFGGFGRSLAKTESVQLLKPGTDAKGPEYDAELRKEIMVRLREEYWDEFDCVGQLFLADKKNNVFGLQTDEGGTIRFGADPLLFKDLMTWMKEDNPVRVQGRALYMPGGERRHVEVDSVGMVEEDPGVAISSECAVPITEQLDALARLEHGWFDGDGSPYATDAIARAKHLLALILDSHELPRPYVYPTPEGEIRIEWPAVEWDVVLTFDAEVTHGNVLATGVDDERIHEETFTVSTDGVPDAEGVLKLSTLLGRLLKTRSL